MAEFIGYLPCAIGPWVLRSASGGEETRFDQPSAFAAALRQAMSEARDIELLFAIWEQNVETVRALKPLPETRFCAAFCDCAPVGGAPQALCRRPGKT